MISRARSRITRVGFAFVLLGMFQCVGYVPGIEVELEYRADRSEREGLIVDEALVSIVAVELVACPDLFVFDWRRPFGRSLPVARAHAPEETEQSITFDAMDEPTISGGVMLPDPGRYCGVRLHLMPQPMHDAHTLLLAGELDGEPFVTFSDEPLDVTMTCEDPVELTEASRTTVAITMQPAAWLDVEGTLDLPESAGFQCRFMPTP